MRDIGRVKRARARRRRDSLIIANRFVAIYLHMLHLIRRRDFHSLFGRDRDVVVANDATTPTSFRDLYAVYFSDVEFRLSPRVLQLRLVDEIALPK